MCHDVPMKKLFHLAVNISTKLFLTKEANQSKLALTESRDTPDV